MVMVLHADIKQKKSLCMTWLGFGGGDGTESCNAGNEEGLPGTHRG